MKIVGIYKIVNVVNQKYYVGSSKDALRKDPSKYATFCKFRGEKSRKAKLQYAKNYELISD